MTLPPPSITISGPVLLTTLAVWVMGMVIGSGPQLKVMIPPSATAFTTAAEVQLAGVPVPITRVGLDVFTAWASTGTVAVPSGLPAGTHAAASTIANTASEEATAERRVMGERYRRWLPAARERGTAPEPAGVVGLEGWPGTCLRGSSASWPRTPRSPR